MFFNNWHYRFIGFFLIPCLGLIAQDRELVIEQNHIGKIEIVEYVSMFSEVGSERDTDLIPPKTDEWLLLDNSLLSGGSAKTYWFKMKIKNDAQNQYLVIEDGSIDYLDVYFVKDSKFIRHIALGDLRSFKEREVKVPDFVYLLPQDSFDCFIRIENNVDFKTSLFVSSFYYVIERFQHSNLLWGAYLGILFVLIVYNFFIYLSTNEKAILWYVFYLFFLILSTSGLKGFAFQYLWQDKAYINFFLPSFTSMCLILIILFVCSLLQIRKYEHKAFIVLKGFIALYILTIILNFIEFTEVWLIIQLSSTLLSLYLFVLAFKIHLKGQPIAKYFLLTWSLHLILIVLFVLQVKGYISYNSFLSNGLFFGSAIEATLLSLVVGYKIRMLRVQKEAAEEREITRQEEQRSFLVEQAHEIKNPIHLAASYVGVLARNLGYYNDLLAHYKQLGKEGVDVEKKREEIEKFEDVIKIELVKKELLDGVNSVEMAFNRIKDIANNYNLDPELNQSTDVNKCIRDTLLIFRKESLDTIEIIEELGEIPEIFSYKGKLNQVIINLIKNAIEAIEEKPVLKNEFIFISTRFQSEKLIIRIKDTGVGMSEELKGKVFNKFYTTKAGGTGLGLGVCKKIIENHKGCIHIESEIGKGTEFVVELPLN